MISYSSCLSLPDTSFSIMSSRLIHIAEMARLPSFSWLNNIPLYVFMCVYHIFFIHSSIDGHLGCFHIFSIFYKIIIQSTSTINKCKDEKRENCRNVQWWRHRGWWQDANKAGDTHGSRKVLTDSKIRWSGLEGEKVNGAELLSDSCVY